ncbi:hypothetical protein QUB31_35505, partial [Microcoleus sp. B13-B4]
MPVPQRVCFFVVVGSHLEQARCLFHKESVFLWHFVRNRQDACSTKSLFFVVVCSHLEQARCLFHKESVLLWDGPESPSLWRPRNRSTKSLFFVVVCSHLEQARCLFHKES